MFYVLDIIMMLNIIIPHANEMTLTFRSEVCGNCNHNKSYYNKIKYLNKIFLMCMTLHICILIIDLN